MLSHVAVSAHRRKPLHMSCRGGGGGGYIVPYSKPNHMNRENCCHLMCWPMRHIRLIWLTPVKNKLWGGDITTGIKMCHPIWKLRPIGRIPWKRILPAHMKSMSHSENPLQNKMQVGSIYSVKFPTKSNQYISLRSLKCVSSFGCYVP